MRWAGVLGLSLLAGLAVSVAIGVAAAQMDDRNFGDPRAEASEADRKCCGTVERASSEMV